MPDRKKVIENLERMLSNYDMLDEIVVNKNNEMLMFHRAVAKSALELLKQQEKQVKQWTKEIADNQLAHAPDELDRENWDYKKGVWDGLQMAWNIISEGR